MNDLPADGREALWRRPLTPAERAQLPATPELQLEAHLTDALTQLRDIPVPSNFTARVLAAVDWEDAAAARPPAPTWHWRLWLPRLAATAAILVVAGLGFQRYEAGVWRASLVQTVAVVSAAPAPSVDALENLDAIQRMGQSAHADGELLADLQ